ncbi:DUF2721 domain-containing protein [Rhodoblastus sp.]|uniref:DUF2721 domain-containing protein n=1 Tax=Rhodoblastus sp. TaxID=1962975 RepID=UPI003F9CBAB7
MFDIIPDVQRLTQIFSQATAPTFFLGAVAAFVSLMSSRLSAIIERIRVLNAIPENDPVRGHLKSDVGRLRRRARLLSRGIYAAIISGICATVLLAIVFASEFMGLKYAYGAGFLFIIATIFLGVGLFRFAQEAQIGLAEADEYE